MRRLKDRDRVCDYQGTRWGVIISIGPRQVFCEVLWDDDPKQVPRREQVVGLRRAGERHPLLPGPYVDPRAGG